MEIYSPINARVIDQELDLRALLNSLSGKSFAISPPIEVDNSFMMGLANEDLSEGICFHFPLSALSEVATLLFTDRDRDTVKVWELGKILIPELQTDPLLYRLYRDVEMLSFLCWPRWKETALKLTCLRSSGLGPE
jgi:hypothetical protein